MEPTLPSLKKPTEPLMAPANEQTVESLKEPMEPMLPSLKKPTKTSMESANIKEDGLSNSDEQVKKPEAMDTLVETTKEPTVPNTMELIQRSKDDLSNFAGQDNKPESMDVSESTSGEAKEPTVPTSKEPPYTKEDGPMDSAEQDKKNEAMDVSESTVEPTKEPLVSSQKEQLKEGLLHSAELSKETAEPMDVTGSKEALPLGGSTSASQNIQPVASLEQTKTGEKQVEVPESSPSY